MSGPKAKSTCKNGHLMVPENTVQLFNKNGTKNGICCRTCHPNVLSGKRGPNPKEFCINGHKLTTETTVQLFRNGIKDGRSCKLCDSIEQANYRQRNPDIMYRSRIESQMRLRYGIDSIKERNALLVSQDHKCLICGTPDCSWGTGFHKRWHIDHIHDGTKNHRGILCSDCNLALGKLEPNLNKVIEYLNKYK